MVNWNGVLRTALRVGQQLLENQTSGRSAAPDRPRPDHAQPGRPQSDHSGPPHGGEARSAPTADRARTVQYAPDLDGAADPGEVVWAWVPFEENDGRGKDRPLLVVGREGGDLVGLMLSSQHDRADDRDWMSVGTGDWDRQGRESFVRLDRVLEVAEHGIRREGAVLDQARFDRVADRLRERYGWR